MSNSTLRRDNTSLAGVITGLINIDSIAIRASALVSQGIVEWIECILRLVEPVIIIINIVRGVSTAVRPIATHWGRVWRGGSMAQLHRIPLIICVIWNSIVMLSWSIVCDILLVDLLWNVGVSITIIGKGQGHVIVFLFLIIVIILSLWICRAPAYIFLIVFIIISTHRWGELLESFVITISNFLNFLVHYMIWRILSSLWSLCLIHF